MTENIFMAQPSIFFPYFDFTLMNVYMNTGIKVMILWKSVDFKPQF